MIAASALQRAVYAALSGVITGGVYDNAPPTASYPLTEIGETTGVPDDTHDSEGSEDTVLLHIWDDDTAPDATRAKDIMAEIDDALHHATLVLAGGLSAFLRRTMAELIDEEETTGQLWRHGVMRYRATISEA